MAEQKQNVPDPHAGTTHESDFGRTDRYENKDEPGFNVRNVAGDARREDTARTDDEDPDDPKSDVNRDE